MPELLKQNAGKKLTKLNVLFLDKIKKKHKINFWTRVPIWISDVIITSVYFIKGSDPINLNVSQTYVSFDARSTV